MESDNLKNPGFNNSDSVKAKKGNFVIKDTAEHTGAFAGFVPWSTIAVIESMEVNGEAVDLSDYGLDTTECPIYALFLMGEDQTITKIKLSSGTLNMIKR